MDAAMLVFELSKKFPPEERYSLTDQIRRASRSVATNIAEGWRKRRYPAAFVSKLNDAESEAAETQTWVEFALRCGFLNAKHAADLDQRYEEILKQLVMMISHPEQWSIGVSNRRTAQMPNASSPRLPVAPSPRLLGISRPLA